MLVYIVEVAYKYEGSDMYSIHETAASAVEDLNKLIAANTSGDYIYIKEWNTDTQESREVTFAFQERRGNKYEWKQSKTV